MAATRLRARKAPQVIEGYEDCALDLRVLVGPQYDESDPDDYFLEYEGAVLSGPERDQPIGTISMYVVDLLAAAADDVDAFDVLDAIVSDLAHFCTLLSARTRTFLPKVSDVAGIDLGRILILCRMEIAPQFRGYGLGLQAIRTACKGVGMGCDLAALKAFPFQWEGRVDEGPARFAKDRAKLVNYYRRAGFLPFLRDGLMLAPLPLRPTARPFET
jgi:hypothetical protein